MCCTFLLLLPLIWLKRSASKYEWPKITLYYQLSLNVGSRVQVKVDSKCKINSVAPIMFLFWSFAGFLRCYQTYHEHQLLLDHLVGWNENKLPHFYFFWSQMKWWSTEIKLTYNCEVPGSNPGHDVRPCNFGICQLS